MTTDFHALDPSARYRAARRDLSRRVGGVSGPCRRDPGHTGRCRNEAGSTWEGHCTAPEHPRHHTPDHPDLAPPPKAARQETQMHIPLVTASALDALDRAHVRYRVQEADGDGTLLWLDVDALDALADALDGGPDGHQCADHCDHECAHDGMVDTVAVERLLAGKLAKLGLDRVTLDKALTAVTASLDEAAA